MGLSVLSLSLLGHLRKCGFLTKGSWVLLASQALPGVGKLEPLRQLQAGGQAELAKSRRSAVPALGLDAKAEGEGNCNFRWNQQPPSRLPGQGNLLLSYCAGEGVVWPPLWPPVPLWPVLAKKEGSRAAVVELWPICQMQPLFVTFHWLKAMLPCLRLV